MYLNHKQSCVIPGTDLIKTNRTCLSFGEKKSKCSDQEMSTVLSFCNVAVSLAFNSFSSLFFNTLYYSNEKIFRNVQCGTDEARIKIENSRLLYDGRIKHGGADVNQLSLTNCDSHE